MTRGLRDWNQHYYSQMLSRQTNKSDVTDLSFLVINSEDWLKGELRNSFQKPWDFVVSKSYAFSNLENENPTDYQSKLIAPIITASECFFDQWDEYS